MNYDRRIEAKNPLSILKHKKELLDKNVERINTLIYHIMMQKKHQYDMVKNRLELDNPLAIMDRGYSISSVDNKIISDATKVKKDDILTTKMKNGTVVSKVMEVSIDGRK